MKINSKNEAREIKNSACCTAFEYSLQGGTDLGGVRVEICGRYPERGYALNTECEELAYILSGKGRIGSANEEREFFAGDMVLIAAGEKYCWEGDFTAFLVSHPAWYPGQFQIVD
jgi:mannose-6-phosphate isomerase-like protein (cupin superfamily)